MRNLEIPIKHAYLKQPLAREKLANCEIQISDPKLELYDSDTFSLKSLPAENTGTVVSGMVIVSPVRGLRPSFA